MNEHELSLGLRAIHRERADVADVKAVRQHVLAAPIEGLPQRRSWLPRIDTGGFSMFSALKYIAAGVIVALFGGFLLAGVFTPQPPAEVVPGAVTDSPAPEATSKPSEAPTTSRTDVLPGVTLAVEEVRPGVLRVLGDGVRDLRSHIRDVTVDADEEVWVELGKARDWRIVRLGEPGVSRQLGRKDPWDLDVTSDGRPSIDSPSAYRVFDGDEWVKSRREAEEPVTRSNECEEPHFMVDGDCWIVGWPFGGMYRATDGEDEPVANVEFGLTDDQVAWGAVPVDDGAGWVFVYEDDWMGPPDGAFAGLLGYDRNGWTWIPYEPPTGFPGEVGVRPFPEEFAFEPDGTLWLTGTSLHGTEPATIELSGPMAISWNGEEWATYGPVDEEMPWFEGVESGTHFAPDGSIWFGGGEIVLRDGSLQSPGLPVDELAFGPDGTAWVATEGPDGGRHLYVITPEAFVAAP